MTLSQSEVLTTSEKTGFNPTIVEKVIHLINLLNALNSHPFLKGKWILGYQSYTGQPGNIEVDFNFMFRQPLWSYKRLPSYQLGKHQSNSIPVLNIHELTAGKLVALLARSQARDLYDSHRILTTLKLQPKLLRISFVVYGGMNRVDWRTVSKENISFDPEDLSRKL